MAVAASTEMPVGQGAEGLGFDADVAAMSGFINTVLLNLRLIVVGGHLVGIGAVRFKVHIVYGNLHRHGGGEDNPRTSVLQEAHTHVMDVLDVQQINGSLKILALIALPAAQAEVGLAADAVQQGIVAARRIHL